MPVPSQDYRNETLFAGLTGLLSHGKIYIYIAEILSLSVLPTSLPAALARVETIPILIYIVYIE